MAKIARRNPIRKAPTRQSKINRNAATNDLNTHHNEKIQKVQTSTAQIRTTLVWNKTKMNRVFMDQGSEENNHIMNTLYQITIPIPEELEAIHGKSYIKVSMIADTDHDHKMIPKFSLIP